MADGVAITAGTGTTILTDDTGAGGHAQVIKLAISTDASPTLIPADATNGLLVDVKRVQGVVAIGDGTDTVAVSTAGADAESNTGNRLEVESYLMAFNGTTWDRSRGDVTSGLLVNVSQALADDSAFTAATSKVVPAGFMADDTSTDLVDENDVGVARMTLDRRQIVQLGESAAKDVKGGGTQTGTADQSIMVAGGAGVYNYLQWVTVYNASATNTFVNVKDGATVVAVLPLPAYGGCMFMPPRAIRSTANTAFNLASGASVTTAYLYGGGYTSTG